MSKPYYKFSIGPDTLVSVDARDEGEARRLGAEKINEMIDDGFRFGTTDVSVADVGDEVESPAEESDPVEEVDPESAADDLPGEGEFFDVDELEVDDDEDEE